MNDTNLSRRDIFRLLAAASAAGAMLPKQAAADPPLPLTRNIKNALSDPDYSTKVIPWDKPLVESELLTLTALVDLILPADGKEPSASEIGVPDFLNEWVGAPYKDTIEDCEIIRGGVAWINTHSTELHQKRFEKLSEAQQIAILDSICDPSKSTPELAYGVRFFKRLRMLTLGGYYTHSKTWEGLGYVGNRPIAGPWPGVPDEIIKILDVADMV